MDIAAITTTTWRPNAPVRWTAPDGAGPLVVAAPASAPISSFGRDVATPPAPGATGAGADALVGGRSYGNGAPVDVSQHLTITPPPAPAGGHHHLQLERVRNAYAQHAAPRHDKPTPVTSSAPESTSVASSA